MRDETLSKIPMPFLIRRLHSLTGLFITLYLIEHLFVNSQAALFFGDDGKSFIHAVNGIQNIPYLKVIEILFLAVPILLHGYYGIFFARQAKFNSIPSDGSKPYLPYAKNKAYSWQRITSWILLFGILLHVYHMRIHQYPEKTQEGNATSFLVEVDKDSGYNTLAPRLDVTFIEKEGKTYAKAKSFGTAELLVLRESFKSPLIITLYTLFVLSACFHGFNGLWTFCLSWGIVITEKSQKLARRFCYGLMALVTFFGLVAIFGTYWINLKG